MNRARGADACVQCLCEHTSIDRICGIQKLQSHTQKRELVSELLEAVFEVVALQLVVVIPDETNLADVSHVQVVKVVIISKCNA